jgi:predicted membrane protein
MLTYGAAVLPAPGGPFGFGAVFVPVIVTACLAIGIPFALVGTIVATVIHGRWPRLGRARWLASGAAFGAGLGACALGAWRCCVNNDVLLNTRGRLFWATFLGAGIVSGVAVALVAPNALRRPEL